MIEATKRFLGIGTGADLVLRPRVVWWVLPTVVLLPWVHRVEVRDGVVTSHHRPLAGQGPVRLGPTSRMRIARDHRGRGVGSVLYRVLTIEDPVADTELRISLAWWAGWRQLHGLAVDAGTQVE